MWWKIAAPLITLGVGGLLAFGAIREGQQRNNEAIQSKASRETVDVQFQAVLRELQIINQRLDRIERRTP